METLSCQNFISYPIPIRIGMLAAVDLYDHFSFEAYEIEDIGFKRHLPAKFETAESSAAEDRPHGPFCIGGMNAKFPCVGSKAARMSAMIF